MYVYVCTYMYVQWDNPTFQVAIDFRKALNNSLHVDHTQCYAVWSYNILRAYIVITQAVSTK